MDTKQRLAEAIANLERARAEFDAATAPLDPATVDAHANWSVLDHVRHVAHPGAYPKWIRSIATDRSWSPPDQSGPGGYWRWTRQNAMEEITAVIAFARNLPEYQIARKAKLGSRMVDAIDLMNGMANHYIQHSGDIRTMTGQAASGLETNRGMAVAE